VGLIFSSFFIWQIEVEGNENVSTSEILASLRKYGVTIGTCTLTVENDYISDKVLLDIPELSWMAINTKGSRAVVIVREKREKPEIVDMTVPTSVYAGKTGTITKITVLRGTPQVSVGDSVLEGDILVSSQVASVSSGDRFVRADAEIWAKTWYNISDTMPLNYTGKVYTGGEKTRTAIILGKKRINLYFSGGNPYASYDKITMYNNIKAFDGSPLPLTIIKESFIPYETEKSIMTAESGGKILEARLMERLNDEIGDGSVENVSFNYSVENGVLTVTMEAQCLENIARLQSLTEDEIEKMTPPVETQAE
jgi:similar to stage IV sporulation protein